MTAQVIDRDRLGVLSKIGQGGQGVVYRAPNAKTTFAASMVYKQYKGQALAEIDFTALAAMPALVEESLSYTEAERLISIAAWPCRIVEDAGTPTGFVMPAIPEEFFIALTTAKGVSPSTAEFQHLLNHPSVLAARGITVDDAQRCTLLREVASGLAFLHKHGVCVGDISPKNLLFALTPQEGVYFIDCDGMRINGISALPQVETPGWEIPRGEELATIYSDTYKLGLLALRLVTGHQDTKNPAHLPSTTPALLRQIITDTLTNPPPQRPLPEAWTYVLGHAIEEAQHQKQIAAPAPVSAAPAPPPIPIVHSRPPVGSSAPPVPPPRPADRPPPQIGTPTPQPRTDDVRRQPKWAGVAALIVILAVAGIVFLKHPIQHLLFGADGTPTAQPAYGPQVTLPFTGLKRPNGVAVDSRGALYVTDGNNSRVLQLAAGSSIQAMLPFAGLLAPEGVTVDSAANIYVAEGNVNGGVVKLATGSSASTRLPLWGFSANCVAVSSAGTVYVTVNNIEDGRVFELAAGSSAPTVLPFAALKDPDGLALDSSGSVYVAETFNNRVLKLAAGSSIPTALPFTGLNHPGGVAVDTAGNLYVVDSGNNQVLRLPAGSSTSTVLPFTGLNDPDGVAVDSSGNVFVVDALNNRVLKLAAG